MKSSRRLHSLALTLLCLLILLLMPACAKTSAERVEAVRQAIVFYEEQSAAVDSQLLDLETYLAASRIEMDKALATGDDTLIEKATKLVASLEGKVAKARALKVEADKTVASLRTSLDRIESGADGVGLAEELETYGVVLTTSSSMIPPPWGTIVGLGGLLVGGIAQGMKVRQGTAFRQVIRSVDKVKDVAEEQPLTAAQIREILGSVQTLKTGQIVDRIKDSVKAGLN